MTDETALPPAPPAAPKKKRKYRKRVLTAKPHKPLLADEYAGMTINQCPAACSAEHCVISGDFYCAHPRKAGLQGRGDAKSRARFEKAMEIINAQR